MDREMQWWHDFADWEKSRAEAHVARFDESIFAFVVEADDDADDPDSPF